MKNLIVLISAFFSCAMFLSSCHEDVDNWDSATLDYSGRYVIKLLSEDGQEVYLDYDGTEIQIYNTAANVANEIWLDDMKALFPLKSKFFLEGTPAGFSSAQLAYEQLTDNLYSYELPGDTPEADGESVTEERYYLRAAIYDRKITKGGYTTKGGNLTDAISFKIKIYSGTATFTSYILPESEWASPTTPEYAWKQESVQYDPELDETYLVEGYRYTGFDEDEY